MPVALSGAVYLLRRQIEREAAAGLLVTGSGRGRKVRQWQAFL